MEVTVRELKAQLSAVVRRVRAGESALVTWHRRPVARLVPAAPAGEGIDDRLLAAGLTAARPAPGGLHRRARNALPPGARSVAEAVLEDRG